MEEAVYQYLLTRVRFSSGNTEIALRGAWGNLAQEVAQWPGFWSPKMNPISSEW